MRIHSEVALVPEPAEVLLDKDMEADALRFSRLMVSAQNRVKDLEKDLSGVREQLRMTELERDHFLTLYNRAVVDRDMSVSETNAHRIAFAVMKSEAAIHECLIVDLLKKHQEYTERLKDISSLSPTERASEPVDNSEANREAKEA